MTVVNCNSELAAAYAAGKTGPPLKNIPITSDFMPPTVLNGYQIDLIYSSMQLNMPQTARRNLQATRASVHKNPQGIVLVLQAASSMHLVTLSCRWLRSCQAQELGLLHHHIPGWSAQCYQRGGWIVC
jgi:hypothetical protein